MIWRVPKTFENAEIIIPIKTLSPQRIYCIASNADEKGHPNTVYFNLDAEITGATQFNVKIPRFPEQGVLLEVYNEASGHAKKDDTFRIGNGMRVAELEIPIDKFARDKKADEFAEFSHDLSEDAGFIPAQNKIYVSPDDKFRIDYKDVIRDDNGRILMTPARISANTGIIEISKRFYKPFSVPGRVAINFHEWAHMYRNLEKSNEFQADKNAIYQYLMRGYPRSEALLVFLHTFQNTPSDMNTERYNALKKYIDNFSLTHPDTK